MREVPDGPGGGSDTEDGHATERLAIPDVHGEDANYPHTDDGVVPVGTVGPQDVLLSKTVVTGNVGEGARRNAKSDKSVVQRHEHGVVDSVMRCENVDGTHITKIRVRATRSAVVGDKLSSRMGQKGIIGRVLPQEEMPFSEDGVVPDLILNPHAIPSRMTIGQVVESLLCLLSVREGKRGDGTIFRDVSVDQVCERLREAGLDYHGRTKMRCGYTGEEYESCIFLSPTFYQEAEHQSMDKWHAREEPVNILSAASRRRGEVEGRRARFGEMERDTPHRPRSVGLFEGPAPRQLGPFGDARVRHLAASRARAENTLVRNKHATCKNRKGSDVREMHVPFAFQLMLRESQAMSVKTKFEF